MRLKPKDGKSGNEEPGNKGDAKGEELEHPLEGVPDWWLRNGGHEPSSPAAAERRAMAAASSGEDPWFGVGNELRPRGMTDGGIPP